MNTADQRGAPFVRVCACESKIFWLALLSKKPSSRGNSDWTEQSHFRSCASWTPEITSSCRWQTDYISSICRTRRPLSFPLRCQPVITRGGEGGVAINMEAQWNWWDVEVRCPNLKRLTSAPGPFQTETGVRSWRASGWWSFCEHQSCKISVQNTVTITSVRGEQHFNVFQFEVHTWVEGSYKNVVANITAHILRNETCVKQANTKIYHGKQNPSEKHCYVTFAATKTLHNRLVNIVKVI